MKTGVYSYRVSFYSLKEEFGFEITSNQEESIREFVNNLLAIFAVYEEEKGWVIDAIQVKTKQTQERIEQFVEKYGKQLPVSNKLLSFIEKFEEGEPFVFLPKIDLQQDERFKLYDHLHAIKESKTFDEIHQQRINLFQSVHKNYALRHFGATRLSIGEPFRQYRVCRFCNNQRTPLTFKKKAHAISEALGNKNLVLYDECDGCNEYFSKTIEPDIVEFYAVYRTFFGVKGKGGEKKYTGKNFKLKKEQGQNIHIEMEVESKDELAEKLPYTIILKSKHPLTSQNIYKSHCKYFLSLISADLLPIFSDTIKWINGEIQINKLPVVAETISYEGFTHQPKVMTYIRKTDDDTIPFAVGELHFTCIITVFIIPLANKPEQDFTVKENYDKFWSTFKHFKESKGWAYHNHSSNTPRPFTLNLVMNMKEK